MLLCGDEICSFSLADMLKGADTGDQTEERRYSVILSGSHSGPVISVSCAQSKPLLVSAGDDHTIRVWDHRNWTCNFCQVRATQTAHHTTTSPRTAYYYLPTYHLLPTTYYFPLTTHCPLLTAHCSLHRSLLTAHWSLLTSDLLPMPNYQQVMPERLVDISVHPDGMQLIVAYYDRLALFHIR